MYLSLGETPEQRHERYKDYVKVGISEKEIEMLRKALLGNRLTGNDRFVEEINERLGIRIETRSRGRPEKQRK